MTSTTETTAYRTIARIVGVVYLAGFVVGIAGNILIQSILAAPNQLVTLAANSTMLAISAVLWLLAVAGDAAHGILMFPILKQQSERMAVGYFAARIVDAIFIAIMVLFVLIQIPLGSEYVRAAASSLPYLQMLSSILAQAQLYAYEIGMSALGLAGLMLCSTLYRAKLLPRWLAIWGLVGYAIILVGMLSAVLGSGLGDLSSLPGGLWELFVGVWLIVKGFRSPAVGPQGSPTRSLAESRAA
jgi:hypothetical protein